MQLVRVEGRKRGEFRVVGKIGNSKGVTAKRCKKRGSWEFGGIRVELEGRMGFRGGPGSNPGVPTNLLSPLAFSSQALFQICHVLGFSRTLGVRSHREAW